MDTTPTSLARAVAAVRPLVWLDFHDYAAGLFRSPVPWLDQTAFSAFHAKAQGLLRSDVIALPVEPIADALLATDAGLRAAMASKSRSVYPLRRLLDDERLRDAVSRLLVVLRASHADRPLALMIPSPRRWLAIAYSAARGETLDPGVADDADEIDGASVYVADFMRAFVEGGIDVLLLCETPDQPCPDTGQLVGYQSVFNVARHYRWEIGLLGAGAQALAIEEKILDFSVARDVVSAGIGGCLLDAAFWRGTPPLSLAAGQFYYAVIPPQAPPESVLERLALLRADAMQSDSQT